MDEQNARNSVGREIWSWVKTIALALAIALIIRTFIYEPMEVPTGSMISTINIGDAFFVNKYIYRFTPIKNGDIVAFWYPDDPTKRYVKRVIGIGGDTVEVRNGQVFVNGKQLTEPYLREPMKKENFGPYHVPQGMYFMMGDNRNDSWDSRYWTNTYVKRSAIIGRAALRMWPLNRIGVIR